MESRRKTVLILGGTGYLGQFLVESLAAEHQVAFTYHSTDAPKFPNSPEAFWVDLGTGEGLHNVFDSLGPVNVVINCAAMSVPGLCEKHPQHARALNVPTQLLDALDIHKCAHDIEPLLIFFSTDQVYDGCKANWTEDDACQPVNVYGQTKVEAEQLIQERWPNHVILRSSLIYGPQSPHPVSRSLFLQFAYRALTARKPTTFFVDEFRNPIFIRDIVSITRVLVARSADFAATADRKLFNMGGPQRFSRADMAYELASFLKVDPEGIVLAAPAASQPRGVASPADISMNSSRLLATLDMTLTNFADALVQIKLEVGDA